jgi:hypothetical protein
VPLWITDPQYGGHDKDIQSFGQFLKETGDFGKTVGQHLHIWSENVKFFKTHKNTNTRPLWITDLQYGVHDQEILSFGQFLPQTAHYRQNGWLAPTDFEQKFEFFQYLSKLIYGTIMYMVQTTHTGPFYIHRTVMYNRSAIWGLRPRNTEFRSNFSPNKRF